MIDSLSVKAHACASGELKAYQECGEEVLLLLEKYQIGEDL
nr:hypothetical protein [Allofrancisella frigidaquae]